MKKEKHKEKIPHEEIQSKERFSYEEKPITKGKSKFDEDDGEDE
jgi:hypothetical protein